MSDGKNFSRRRRGGMRFRPSGNQQRRPAAQEARAATQTDATTGNEGLFDKSRQNEIERAQNVAAGLPAEGAPKPERDAAPDEHSKKDFREPHLNTPAEVKEEFKPVEIQEQPKGIVDAIKMAAQ